MTIDDSPEPESQPAPHPQAEPQAQAEPGPKVEPGPEPQIESQPIPEFNPPTEHESKPEIKPSQIVGIKRERSPIILPADSGEPRLVYQVDDEADMLLDAEDADLFRQLRVRFMSTVFIHLIQQFLRRRWRRREGV